MRVCMRALSTHNASYIVLISFSVYADMWYWVDGTAAPTNPVWHFSDGSPITFDGPIPWYSNRPRYDTTITYTCLTLYININWADRWCTKYMPFICEVWKKGVSSLLWPRRLGWPGILVLLASVYAVCEAWNKHLNIQYYPVLNKILLEYFEFI